MSDENHKPEGANHETKDDLVSKVNDKESKGFIRKAFDLAFNTTMAAGSSVLSYSLLGASTGFFIGGAFAAGGMIGNLFKKKEERASFSDSLNSALKTYATLNTVLYPMVALGNVTYPLVGNMGASIAGNVGAFAAKSAYALSAYNWAFTGSFKAVHHIYENKFDLKGIDKSIATNFWPDANRFSWAMAPGYILTANGIHNVNIAGYKAPVFSVNALPTGIYNAINPPGQKLKNNVHSDVSVTPTPKYTAPQMMPNLAGATA